MPQEIYKILIFMKRREGLSVEAFRDYYENRHVPLCLKYSAGVRRYVRRYVQGLIDQETGQPRELDFDVVTELWFDDRATFEGALSYAGRGILPKEVIADEERLFERSSIRFTSVVECETDAATLAAAGH